MSNKLRNKERVAFDMQDGLKVKGKDIEGITGSELVGHKTTQLAARKLDLILDDVEPIVATLTLYVATTGNDTTGDGSLANPWYSPHKALQWLSTHPIRSDVGVNINCAAGEYNFVSAIELDLAFGNKVNITGAAMLGNTPIGINEGADSLTCTGYDLTERDADYVTNLALIKSRFATVFNFSHATIAHNCINVKQSFGQISGIAFIGDNIRTSAGVAVTNGSNFSFSKLAFCKLTLHAISLSYGGRCIGNDLIAFNTNSGVATIHGGNFSITNGTFVSTTVKTINISFGGNGRIVKLSVAGCSDSDYAIGVYYGGSLWCGNANVFFNKGHGIIVYFSGVISCGSSLVHDNDGCGVYAYGGAILTASSTITYNKQYGIRASLTGFVGADNVILNNNSLVGTGCCEIKASDNACIYSFGAVMSGAGLSPSIRSFGYASITVQNSIPGITYSPAYGTVGNGNAIIGNFN